MTSESAWHKIWHLTFYAFVNRALLTSRETLKWDKMDFMLLRMYTILLGLLKWSSLLILPELYREIFFRQPQRSVEIVGFFRQNGRDFVVVWHAGTKFLGEYGWYEGIWNSEMCLIYALIFDDMRMNVF